MTASTRDNTPIDLGALDFTGVSTEFEPLAAGLYDAVIEDSELRYGQTTNNPYLNITCGLRGEAGKMWTSYTLTPKAMFRIKRDMIRMGMTEDEVNAIHTVEEIQEAIKNRAVQLDIIIEEYKPKEWVDGDPLKKRNSVKELYGPNGEGRNGSATASTGANKPAGNRKRGGF